MRLGPAAAASSARQRRSGRGRFGLTLLPLALLPLASGLSLPAAAAKVVVGAGAGAFGALCFYPIDVIKTRLQSSSGAQFEGGLDCTRQLLVNEGPLGLYEGLPVQLGGVAPQECVKLVVNDGVRGLWLGTPIPLAGEVLAGVAAGLCQVAVTNPLEAVKVRLQLAGGCASASEVVAELGLGGLYRGAAACAARDASFSAITFPIYAHAKEWVAELGLTGGAALLLAGVAAAAPAAYFATPADVVKTRQQQGCGLVVVGPVDEGCDTAIAPCDPEAAALGDETVGSVAASVYAEAGASGFFAGGFERAVQHGPQMAVTLAAFDVGMAACLRNGWLA